MKIFTGACVLGTLCSFCGYGWWVFELGSHFRVQYASTFLLLTLLAGCLTKWRTALVFVTLAALHAVPLQFCVARVAQQESGNTPIRILSANVSRRNLEHELFLALVRNELPDVVFILEMTTEWRSVIDELRPMYPHVVSEPRVDAFGIAMLSRVEPQSHSLMHLEDHVPLIKASFQLPSGLLTIFGCHCYSPTVKQRFIIRNKQLEQLADLVTTAGPVACIGDFNLTPWSPYFGHFLQRTGFRDSRLGWGNHATWPTSSRLMRIPIDHCLVSPDVVVKHRALGTPIGSDHLPLIVAVQPSSDTQTQRQGTEID